MVRLLVLGAPVWLLEIVPFFHVFPASLPHDRLADRAGFKTQHLVISPVKVTLIPVKGKGFTKSISDRAIDDPDPPDCEPMEGKMYRRVDGKWVEYHEPYYCTKCKRRHERGKIVELHHEHARNCSTCSRDNIMVCHSRDRENCIIFGPHGYQYWHSRNEPDELMWIPDMCDNHPGGRWFFD